MNRSLLLLAVLAIGAAVVPIAAEASKLAQNPIIHADVPHMAMIRVGDTCYMSSPPMHMSPGLPIMKSKDLVNWQLVGYAYYVSPQTAHEWQSWRRGLYQFAPLLFQD